MSPGIRGLGNPFFGVRAQLRKTRVRELAVLRKTRDTAIAKAIACNKRSVLFSPSFRFCVVFCGQPLNKFCDPDTGRCWLCVDGANPNLYCWESEHPAYVAPDIGVTQADADLHAASEIAYRAALDAQAARDRMQAAEMRATACFQTAAEKADGVLVEKQAAPTSAEEAARANREAYDREKALANADARHRAARIAIPAGTTPLAEGQLLQSSTPWRTRLRRRPLRQPRA